MPRAPSYHIPATKSSSDKREALAFQKLFIEVSIAESKNDLCKRDPKRDARNHEAKRLLSVLYVHQSELWAKLYESNVDIERLGVHGFARLV